MTGTPSSLRGLLTEIVQVNVAEYNNKAVEPWIMKYLSTEETDNQIRTECLSAFSLALTNAPEHF